MLFKSFDNVEFRFEKKICSDLKVTLTTTVYMVDPILNILKFCLRKPASGSFIQFVCDKVGQKRWKVETFSKQDSVLLLSSVNLPGGELVRKWIYGLNDF